MKHILFLLIAILIVNNGFSQACYCPRPGKTLIKNGEFNDPNTIISSSSFTGFESDYRALGSIQYGELFNTFSTASVDTSFMCNFRGISFGPFMLFIGAADTLNHAVPPYDFLRYPNIPVGRGLKYTFSFAYVRAARKWRGTVPNANITIVFNNDTLGSFPVLDSCSIWRTARFCWLADTDMVTIHMNAGIGDTAGRDFGIDSVQFYSCSLDTININASGICGLQTFTATSNDPTVLSYNWNFGDSTTGTGNPIVHTYKKNGSYPVTVYTGNANDVKDSTTDTITINNNIPVSVNIASITQCVLDSAKLLVTGATSYTWTPDTGLNNPNIANPKASPSVTTTYHVTGVDSNGCIGQDSVTIHIIPGPPVAITAVDNLVCENQQIQLFATGASTYLWTPETYFDHPGSPNPIVTLNKTTKLYVTGYLGDVNCKTTDSITVYVRSDTAFIPNSFTPNGDGINDVIYPITNCDFHFEQFIVFNRWGQEVFSTKKYKDPWDGTNGGTQQPEGAYVYFIKGHKSDGSPMLIKGNITLLR